jgi:outer membrane protein assembly factor BamE (lipoprotein component of BamABCDE complex)
MRGAACIAHNREIVHMRSSTALLCVLLLLTACASSGTRVQDAALTQFQKGKTTESDVVKVLGVPQMTTTNSDGTRSIAYVYTHAQAKGASFVPIVGLFAGGAKGNINIVTFNFDPMGKLINYQASNSTTDVNTGLGATAAPPSVPK